MIDPEAKQPPADFMCVVDGHLNTIPTLCRVITGVSFAVLSVILGWLLFGRYVLNSTPTWVELAALFLVMEIAILGATVGAHENKHLSVSAFRGYVPAWLPTVFVMMTSVLMAGFDLLMLIYGSKLSAFKWDALIQLPEGLKSLPLTIGGGFIVFFRSHIRRGWLWAATCAATSSNKATLWDFSFLSASLPSVS